MRTNIEIDDTLMAAAMAAGGFKTKKEAVEEGLRLVSRRKVYEGLLALRGQLQWDDSDEGWAQAAAETDSPAAVQQPKARYAAPAKTKPSARKPKEKPPATQPRARSKSA
jgi:Arc/MetJ family transcription regulator